MISGLAALAALALAHGPDELPGGRAPLLDPVTGALVGGVANHGLLLGPEAPRWTPDEGLTSRGFVDGFVAEDGAIVVGSAEGTARTDDGGCTWQPDPTPHRVRALVPVDGRVAYRATERADGPGGVERTDDGGRTWTPTARFAPDLRGLDLVLDPRGRLVALLQDAARGATTVERADGDAFTVLHAPEAPWRGIALDEDHLFGLADSRLDPALVQVDLRSGDVRRVPLPEPATRVAVVDGAPWIALESHAVRVGLALAPNPLRAEDFVPRGGALWALHAVVDGPTHLSRRTAGAWVPHLRFDAVAPAACPPTSPGAATAPAAWDRLQRTGVGATPAVTRSLEGGCRGLGAGYPALWALLGLVRLRRRRAR